MSLVALFSDKGSPGVTTLALALGHAWPTPVALVELDPAGGDLALRLTDGAGRPVLAPEPGLITFAAAARRDAAPSLAEHGQLLSGASGLFVVPGLSAPEQASAMAGLWGAVVTSMAASAESDVIADLGRLHPHSPVHAAAAVADVLIGVCAAEPAAMLRLRNRMRHVLDGLEPKPGRRAGVVLVAADRHAEDSVQAMCEVLSAGGVPAEVVGALVVDPTAVRALHLGDASPRVQRSLLMRSARNLLSAITPLTESRFAALPSAQRRRMFARSR